MNYVLKQFPTKILFLMFLCALCIAPAEAQETSEASKLSQATVYVPLYSHIYFGDALRPFNLAVTVSIRNTDTTSNIELLKAEYHNSDGIPIRTLLEKKVQIKPLGSYSFKVKESDTEGGSGASVVLTWKSTSPVVQPIIESVMIGAASGQGISFTSRGKVIAAG